MSAGHVELRVVGADRSRGGRASRRHLRHADEARVMERRRQRASFALGATALHGSRCKGRLFGGQRPRGTRGASKSAGPWR